MQYIPLIYFSILSIVLYKKHGMDVSFFISLLYVMTSFCSIKIFDMKLVDSAAMNPSLIATVVYCALITFCINAIGRLKTENIDLLISKRTERVLSIMTYLFFGVFVLYIIFYIKDVIFVLTFGDFAQLRDEILQNDSVGQAQGPLGYFKVLLSLFANISFIMVLVFFISVIYLKKGPLFNFFAICGSLTSLLEQILGVSRAGFLFYTIIFGVCGIIFWRKLGRRTKLAVTIPIGAVFVAIFFYFSQVTTDRFDNNQSIGVEEGLVVYAGQPYSNFCNFFDHKPFTGISTRFLLPFTNYVLNDYRGGTQREKEMSKISKMDCVVFMTFLGSFIMDCNQLMPFLYVIIFCSIMNSCIRNKHGTKINFFWLSVAFILMLVPAIGCITYFYTSPFKSLSLIVFLAIIRHNKI